MSEIVQHRGDYYMDVKKFADGSVEAVLKAIRPSQAPAIYSSVDELCCTMSEHYLSSSRPRFASDYDSEPPSLYEQETSHQRSVRRSSQKIRHLVKNMMADRLLTLTYRENVQDRERVKRDFKRFLRLVRKSYPEWRYVAVLEKQERGALHVHCAVQGYQKINHLRKLWFIAIGGSGYETGSETPGSVNVTTPRASRWGTELTRWKSGRLAAYLTKYLEKTFDDSALGNRRYWQSKDLVLPVKQRFVLAATCLVSAIHEAADVLFAVFGQGIDFTRSMLSSSKDTLWLSLGDT